MFVLLLLLSGTMNCSLWFVSARNAGRRKGERQAETNKNNRKNQHNNKKQKQKQNNKKERNKERKKERRPICLLLPNRPDLCHTSPVFLSFLSFLLCACLRFDLPLFKVVRTNPLFKTSTFTPFSSSFLFLNNHKFLLLLPFCFFISLLLLLSPCVHEDWVTCRCLSCPLAHKQQQQQKQPHRQLPVPQGLFFCFVTLGSLICFFFCFV